MQWLRSHIYVAALVGTVILIVGGALIVGRKSAVEPSASSSLRAWGGVGANLSDPTTRSSDQAIAPENSLYTEVRGGPPFYYAPSTAQIPQTQAEGATDFDLQELLATLTHSPKNPPTKAESLTMDAYLFIPSGLLSMSPDVDQSERTEAQQKLYDYGNDVAGNIQSYEDLYRNAPQIMKNQFEDRQDSEKSAALLNLAGGLAGVGSALLAKEEVPSQILIAHEKLARSYKEMGEKLSRIPAAKSDQALLDAILAYNVAAETYTKNYVAFATLFSAYGVKFKSGDPGSIFTFTNAITL
mgnify:CR=1 FL=1